MMSGEHNLNKLAWRARRGTKELDTILQGFLNNHFVGLTPSQQASFSLLLEQSDPDIVDWLNGVIQPEHEGLAEIISMISSEWN